MKSHEAAYQTLVRIVVVQRAIYGGRLFIKRREIRAESYRRRRTLTLKRNRMVIRVTKSYEPRVLKAMRAITDNDLLGGKD